MFISTSNLKKLMSAAYKGSGIRIGHKEEGYLILGSTWGVWIDENHIPNKVKALIMELAGTLPNEDSIFIVSKEKPIPQYEFDFNSDNFYLNQLQSKAKVHVIVTNVLYDNKFKTYKLLQNSKSKELSLMDLNLLNLLDLTEIDFDVENTPSGPCTEYGSSYYWRNATCTLLLLSSKVPENNKIIDTLSSIDFEKEMS